MHDVLGPANVCSCLLPVVPEIDKATHGSTAQKAGKGLETVCVLHAVI